MLVDTCPTGVKVAVPCPGACLGTLLLRSTWGEKWEGVSLSTWSCQLSVLKSVQFLTNISAIWKKLLRPGGKWLANKWLQWEVKGKLMIWASFQVDSVETNKCSRSVAKTNACFHRRRLSRKVSVVYYQQFWQLQLGILFPLGTQLSLWNSLYWKMNTLTIFRGVLSRVGRSGCIYQEQGFWAESAMQISSCSPSGEISTTL